MNETVAYRVGADALDAHLAALSAILAAGVDAGAAISFMQPFTNADAARFWTGSVFPDVRAGGRLLFAAARGGDVVGTVQLIVALPPNQPHRCEVAKLIVHPRARRAGVGRLLMSTLERHARELGKRLITLDTRSDDAAEPLYLSAGFRVAGVIPGFAYDPDGGALHPTTYMYKPLD